MKKIFLASLFVFFSALPATAQTTQVTGQVLDANGIPYSGATMKAGLVFAGTPVSNPTVTISTLSQCKANGFGSAPCQVSFTPSNGPFTLDGSGNIPGGGITLQDNTLVTPAGTQWAFTVNTTGVALPLGTGPQTCSTTITISGSSQSVTSSFSSCPSLALTAVATSGNPFIGAIVQNGIMAEYRILPSESPASLIDYSANGSNRNNAIGTVGTSPTVIAITGGLACNQAGAVILPASLNSAKTIQVFMSFGNTGGGTFQSPVFGNGAGAGSGGTGIVLSIQNPPGFQNARVNSVANNSIRAQQKSLFGGTGLISLVMDTSDRLYINNKEEAVYFIDNASVGLQTTGSYQLCGSATGGAAFTPNYMSTSGNVYYAIFYNRVLSPTEIAQNSQAVAEIMAARGVIPLLQAASGNSGAGSSDQAVFDGDSITAGQGITTPWPSLLNLMSTTSNLAWNIYNQGLTGEPIGNLLGTSNGFLVNGDYAVDLGYRFSAQRNTVVFWGGTNDVFGSSSPAPQTYANLKQYCLARKAAGWRVGVVTMISRVNATGDAAKDFLDGYIRQNWPTFADYLIDIGGTTQIGADGSFANTTYFQVDATHPNQNGADNIVAPLISRGVNRFYGAKDFSSANVYASAAPAATATTSGSESTNTVTVNFAAGSTCLAGTLCTCTGITPAAYNQTYYALTGTPTQFTGFNNTSGLGVITVQGTCSAPQQQDADQYAVLNFGAGNFTLETCQAYTGQNINIRNINAAASTLVPFPGSTNWSAETITGGGATPATLAANTTAILQSQLVSAAAGGCNWVRLQ